MHEEKNQPRNRRWESRWAATLLLLGVASGVAHAASVVNGDFETGDLSGWTLVGGSTDKWYVYSGTSSPGNGFTIPSPPGGTYAAVSDVVNGDAFRMIMYQDITLEAGETHTLTFHLGYINQNSDFVTPDSLSASESNQQMRVDIIDPTAAVDTTTVLANVFKTSVGDPLTMAITPITFDLSAFAGSTVRLRFAQVDTEYYFNTIVDDVVVTSVAPNHAPVAGAQSVATNQTSGQAITLAATDADSDPLTYSVVASPSHGTLSGTAPNLTYTPDNGYTGSDSFTFKANDGHADSNTATVSLMIDTTAPTCTLTSTSSGPPTQVDLGVQDSESGVASIQVTGSTNCTVSVPSFTAGTTSALTVTATKTDEAQAAHVALKITDVAGNVTNYDPVIATLRTSSDGQVSAAYAGLSPSESRITVQNQQPGLNGLLVVVNGWRFPLRGLQDGETRRLDVSRAMRPGSHNVIAVYGQGRPGAGALFTLSE